MPRSPPFPHERRGVENGPQPSRARKHSAAKRTLDGEDRSVESPIRGKGGWPPESIKVGQISVANSRVRFTTAAALVHELMEARDEKRLLRFQKHLARQDLLIVDELGFVPLSKSGAEMLFEIFSQRYERASTLVTSNLPFAEWTEILGSERLTGALLDRLTHQFTSSR
jgi:hypothetical protein